MVVGVGRLLLVHATITSAFDHAPFLLWSSCSRFISDSMDTIDAKSLSSHKTLASLLSVANAREYVRRVPSQNRIMPLLLMLVSSWTSNCSSPATHRFCCTFVFASLLFCAVSRNTYLPPRYQAECVSRLSTPTHQLPLLLCYSTCRPKGNQMVLFTLHPHDQYLEECPLRGEETAAWDTG